MSNKNNVDGQTVQIVIHGFSLWKLYTDLHRCMSFQKQIFYETLLLDFYHFLKNNHIDSLQDFQIKTTCPKLVETLMCCC